MMQRIGHKKMQLTVIGARRPILQLKHIILFLLAIPLMGSFCDDTTSSGDGKVDHPAGVQTFSSGEQNYALVPMPQIGHVRVFDMSAEDFVPAPNVYFPLSIPVGPYSQKLVVDAEQKVGLVLDAADGALRALRLGPASEAESFKVLGQPEPAGLSPAGIAIDSKADGLRYFVSSAHSAQLVAFISDSEFSSPVVDKVWNLSGQPGDVVFAPLANKIIVADNSAARLWIINNDDDTVLEFALEEVARKLVFGQVSLVAGQPAQELILALPARGTQMTLIDPASSSLLASIESASFPQDALLLNAEAADDVKCSGLGLDGPCAYAAILTLNGTLQYLDLQAQNSQGQWTPRFVDSDSAEPTFMDLDENPQLYDPNSDDADAQARRPLIGFSVVEDFGQPAHVYQRASGDYLFTYQGLLPALRDRQGQLNLADSSFVDQDEADLDFANLDVQAGDLLEIPAQQACPEMHRYVISDVAPGVLTLAGVDSAADCMASSAGVRYRLRAGESFTVASQREEDVQGLLGRVAFGEEFDAHAVTIKLMQAVAGVPATGAVLDVSVKDNFSPRTLDFGLRGALPSGISGGMMGTGDEQAYYLLVSISGGSALFAVLPGTEGYVDSTYLLTGVKRFE